VYDRGITTAAPTPLNSKALCGHTMDSLRTNRKWTAAVPFLAVALLGEACHHEHGPTPNRERPGLTPERVGAVRLVPAENFPVEQRDLIQAAIEDITRSKQDPSEFYVTVGTNREGARLNLWHQSAFLPENKHAAGNPGGRCFTMYFDRNGKIEKRLKWQ
jgi:hypothetical protein